MIDLKSKANYTIPKKLGQQQKLPIAKLKKFGQDLGTVLMCCSLDSFFKILPYHFFSYEMEVYFLVKWSNRRILKGKPKK